MFTQAKPGGCFKSPSTPILEGGLERTETAQNPFSQPQCVSREYGCRGNPNSGFLRRSHENRKGAEGGFATEARRSKLRRIPTPKNRRFGRTWIVTASLLASCRALASVRTNVTFNAVATL